MANNEKITIFFEPKGDKKLVKAINSLSRAQGRLSKSTENVNRTNQRNSKSSDKSSASMMALGGTMSVVRSKLLVYGFATGLATKVTQVFTSAAMKQEDVEKKLAVQLGFVSNRLLEYASAQQKVTRFGDEEVISVMGQISAFSKNEEQIESLKEEIGEYQEQLEDTDDMTEEEELLGMIEELEETIEDIENDDDYYEWTEEAKENYVESRLDDVRYDPVGFLRDYGMEEQIENFIDKHRFIEDVIYSDGRGHTIASYDGEEDEVYYDNETYYIYRMINKNL